MAGFLFGILWEVVTWNNFTIPRAIIGAITGSAG
jgi:hypothetical protein